MLLQVIYYGVCLIVHLQAISFITASLQPFLKDLTQFIAIILQVLFWVTPILWSTEILSPKLEVLFKLNPLFYIVNGYRDSFLYGIGFWHKPLQTIYFWGLNIILLIIGFAIYKKLKTHFSDVL
jgi:teichoic acid transport system permease protein